MSCSEITRSATKRLLLVAWGLLCCLASLPAQDTATVRLTAGRDFLQHLSWSPDGKRFLFTRIHAGQMGLWTMNADGAELKPLLPQEKMPQFDGHWSPDSNRIVFVYDRLQGTDGKQQIDVIKADGNEQRNAIPHQALEESPRWSPDGKQIAWVSTRGKNQDVWLADADGRNPRRLTSDLGPDTCPAWSPDGKHIAFCSGRTGNLDLFVMKADGSDPRRLTAHPKLDSWPAWSPDGKRLAFTSNRDGNFDIYLMNADGTGLRNLTHHPAQDNFAAWSPDGKRLAFISNRGGGYGIFVIEVD